MFDVIYAEFVKIKRSGIYLLTVLAGLIPALLMLLLFGDKEFHAVNGKYVYGWEYFFDVTVYYVNVICPAFYATFAGYIFTREYQYKTINTILTYPFSRFRVFVSKLLVVIPMIILVALFSMIFTLIIGLFLDRDALTPDVILTFLKINMQMVFFNFGLIPLAALAAIIGKNILIPIVLGISYILSYPFLTKLGMNAFTPGCIPSLISTNLIRKLGANHPIMYHYSAFNANLNNAYVTLAVIFFASLIACLIYFRYSEVK